MDGIKLIYPSISDYYTRNQIDTLFSTISGGTGEVTYVMLVTTSGDIVSQIPSLSGYATQSWVSTNYIDSTELTTTSGDIINYIDQEISTISGGGDVTYEMLLTTSGDIIDYIDEQITAVSGSSGISEEQLVTTSGDIVAQIPSLTGYATQTWVSDNYIDSIELTTSSGDIVAQIPSLVNYITQEQLTTTSGDIVLQIPTDYITNEQLTTTSGDIIIYVDQQISTISGGSGDVTLEMLTTTSGDIVDQIPSITGYATQSWVSENYIDNNEMTTISGDVIAYIDQEISTVSGGSGITQEQLTTTSGDIVDQIPSLSGYATQNWVTTVSGDIISQVPTTASEISARLSGYYVYSPDGSANLQVDSITPVMTSNTAPSPFVVSVDSYYDANYVAFKAFNQDGGSTFWNSQHVLPHWIKVDLGSARKITKYRWRAVNRSFHESRSPSTWTIEGSNDNLAWDGLDSRSGVGTPGMNQWTSYYTFTNNSFYRYYRMYITANTLMVDGYIELGELHFVEAHLVLISTFNYLEVDTDTSVSGALITLDTNVYEHIITTSGVLAGQIPSLETYVTEEKLTTVSGDIVSQIPSLTGYATESYVSENYIDTSEMTTISGDLQLQIPSLSGYATEIYVSENYIDTSEMTTISGDLISYIDTEISTISGGGDVTTDMLTTTSGDIVSYIDAQLLTVSGGGLACAACTSSGLVVDNAIIAPSGIFTEGIQVGSGTVRITGDGITFPDNSIITVAPPQFDLFDTGLTLNLFSDASGSEIENLGYFGSDANFEKVGTWTNGTQGDAPVWVNSGGSSSVVRLMAHHTNTNPGASFSSANLSDGSASFAITDTNLNLQSLFGMDTQPSSLGKRFKIDAGSNASSRNWITGYIGNVAKAGDTYTLDIYNGPYSATRSWHKYSLGSWNGSDILWWIYPAFFDYDHDNLRGYATSCWFYEYDATADWSNLITKMYAVLTGVEDVGIGFCFQHTNVDYTIQWNSSYVTNGLDVIAISNAIKTGRWFHFALIQNRWQASRTLMINGEVIGVGTARTSSCCMGLFAFAGQGNGGGGLPSGSKIAFPRYWKGDTSPAQIRGVYEYERNLMGLRPNH